MHFSMQVAEDSLLLKWQGSDGAIKPILCVSHLDVASAEPEQQWSHPPFSGVTKDGFIWGRGALDVKGILSALLEAIAHLLHQGY